MKTRILFSCLLGFLLSFGSCKDKGDDIAPNYPDGIWVEQQARLDTLQFLDERFLDLRRGRVLSGGHLLPKSGSGWYDYQIQEDSISLLSILSSSTIRHQYYFNVKSESITMGDFYNNPASAQKLTFVRLR